MAAVRVTVQGWVQGVGFRAFVLRLAAELGLEGEVWNRLDGGVEAVAEHESRAVLEEFAARIRGGPGRVRSVETEWHSAPAGHRGFHIGPSR